MVVLITNKNTSHPVHTVFLNQDQTVHYVTIFDHDMRAMVGVYQKDIKLLAREKAKSLLKWEGNINTTVHNMIFMGTSNRPDMSIEYSGVKIAIDGLRNLYDFSNLSSYAGSGNTAYDLISNLHHALVSVTAAGSGSSIALSFAGAGFSTYLMNVVHHDGAFDVFSR